MKYIEVDYHFVGEMVASRRLRVCVISGNDQTLDLLTKPLPKQRFHQLRFKLNLLPALRLRGDVEEVRTASSDNQPSQPVHPSEPVGKPDQSLT